MANEDITKALSELDSGNDGHWTDDGLPRVDVIQTLLKDPTIKRKDINEAAPGFARASEKTTEPEDVQPGDPAAETVAVSTQPAENADLAHDDGLNLDPADPLSDNGRLSVDELKEVMAARISQAEVRLEHARKATRDAVEYERKCTGWTDKAKLDYNRRFPPLHPSDAIKAHLQSQLEQRYRAAGLEPPKPGDTAPTGVRGPITPISPLDQTMSFRKKQSRVNMARAG